MPNTALRDLAANLAASRPLLVACVAAAQAHAKHRWGKA